MNDRGKIKLLFVIHRLDVGGAEKSFVSLLNSLPEGQFDITVKAQKTNGIFRQYIPDGVKVSELPADYICMAERISNVNFWRHASLRTVWLKAMCIIGCHLRGKESKSRMSHEQFYNEFWKKHMSDVKERFDVAVSYMDCTNYYVIDHVNAARKILWCHNDYNKLDYNAAYDTYYYNKADKVCTISQTCLNSLLSNFPSMTDKFDVVENISSKKMILAQSYSLDEMRSSEDGFFADERFKILSIGRLSEQKGFDMAVDAASILKGRGVRFCWYILGIGFSQKDLEEQVKRNDVSDVVKFIGVRSNPYPYMRMSDMFVMSSRYEGKSIALDEAKILCKPIVSTNYPTVGDALTDGVNGMIVDMSAMALADGIWSLYNDERKRQRLSDNLSEENCDNADMVVSKFLDLVK